MKVVQVPNPGDSFVLADREIPNPGPGAVRLKVAACGTCPSDVLVQEGRWPNLTYPRVRGHEAAGVIEAVGPEVADWTARDRLAIGWHGSHKRAL
jgi:D-arabinose 1-dehydrogenase-like Zn-dependent alcohol dehydrogenase